VRGREHARALRNNQDCAIAAVDDEIAIAVVCDGCSSGPSSEVGARFAAAWLARRVPEYARRGEPARAWIDDATAALLGALGGMARALAPRSNDLPRTVHDFLLFAFLAAVITRDRAVVFGAGDGVVATADRITILDAGPDNAPRYLSYALLAPEPSIGRASIATIHLDEPADALSAIVLATDGAAELEGRALFEVACDDRYLRNASLLQKRLVVMSENERRFYDDTSIAVIRRKEALA
jgi:hypothetical protein